jgi:hypothetical protein
MTTPIPFGQPIDWPTGEDVTTPAGFARWQAYSWINQGAAAKLQADAIKAQTDAINAQAYAIAAQTAINADNAAAGAAATNALAVANAALAANQGRSVDAQDALRVVMAAGVQVERDRLTWDQARWPIPEPTPTPAPVPAPAPAAGPTPLHVLAALLQAALVQWQADYPEA